MYVLKSSTSLLFFKYHFFISILLIKNFYKININGQPTIRGSRITVETILQFLFSGSTQDEILQEYPFLEKEDIQACYDFTLKLISSNFSIKDVAA